jgi:hypothetical protein
MVDRKPSEYFFSLDNKSDFVGTAYKVLSGCMNGLSISCFQRGNEDRLRSPFCFIPSYTYQRKKRLTKIMVGKNK